MDEEQLIHLVQIHRELYDTSDPLYEVRQKREQAWREIGSQMKESARECKDKWKRIRDNYRRALKLRRMKSEQGAKMKKKTKYENILSFLNPYLRDEIERNSEYPATGSVDSNDDGSADEVSEKFSAEETHSPDATSSKDSTYNPPPLKRQFVDHTALLPQPSSPRCTYQPHSEPSFAPASAPPTNHDKIKEFFMGLVATVNDFPEDVQIRVKRDIFKIISEAEQFVYENSLKTEFEHSDML